MEDKRRGKIEEKRGKNEQTVGFLAEKLPQNEQSEATEKLQHKNRYKKTIFLPFFENYDFNIGSHSKRWEPICFLRQKKRRFIVLYPLILNGLYVHLACI